MTLPANWASGQQFTAAAENAVEAAVNNLQLAPVAVKTANYTASVGQLVPVDATSAAVTVTLPTAPADQSQVVVKKVDSGANAVTVSAGTGDKFNSTSDGTSLTLSLQYQTAELLYSASQHVWYVMSTDAPLAVTDTRYVQTANVSATPAASAVAAWDASKNFSANALLPAQSSTVTAAATTTLTIASAQTQIFTGTSTQTVALPTAGVSAGYSYTVVNQSTGAVTVQSSGLNTITVLPGGQTATFVARASTPTTAANWAYLLNSSIPVPTTSLPNGITNFSTAAQSQPCVANTKYYVASSGLALPATTLSGVNGLTANKSTFIWDVAMNKDGSSSGGTFSIVIFRGVNGTTADTADVTQSLGTLGGQADNMTVEIQLTVTATGSSGSYYWSMVPTHMAASGQGFGLGIGSTAHFSGTVSSVALNTAGLTFGIGFVSTVTPTIGIPQVQSSVFNVD